MQKRDIIFETPPFDLKIYFCRYTYIESWNLSSLSAPFWRMYWAHDSGGSVKLDQKIFELRPSTIAIIPPMTNISSSNKTPFRKFFCHFQIEKMESELEKNIYFCETPKTLKKNAEKLFSRKLSKFKANFLATNFIGAALSSIPEKHWIKSENDPRIEAAINAMKINPAISNKKLAQAAGMAENSFIRFFKMKKSLAPQKFLTTIRIERACELLLHTDKTIDIIAEECGFWDRNHFSMQFKKHIKHPPANYRKMFQYWN